LKRTRCLWGWFCSQQYLKVVPESPLETNHLKEQIVPTFASRRKNPCQKATCFMLHVFVSMFVCTVYHQANAEQVMFMCLSMCREKLAAEKVEPLLLVSSSGAPSASCLCLVTPDGQRTMRTCLGASLELKAADQLPDTCVLCTVYVLDLSCCALTFIVSTLRPKARILTHTHTHTHIYIYIYTHVCTLAAHMHTYTHAHTAVGTRAFSCFIVKDTACTGHSWQSR